MRPRRTQAGFTLVELMISLTVFAVVISGVLAMAVSINVGFREHRGAAVAEGAARGAMDFLGDALRGASPGVPSGAIQHVNTCASGALSVIDNTTAPDELTVVFASGSAVTSSRTVYDVGTTSLTVADASQLAVGDTLLISNQTKGHLVTVTSVNAATGALGLAAQTCATLALPAGGYAVGALVVRVQRARIYVDTVDGVPSLMIDSDAEGPAAAEPLAEGIEDFQVAIGSDADGDGAVSNAGVSTGDDEWAFNVAGETMPTTAIRAVRITLVARASQLAGTASFTRPAAEDHAASTTQDGYRRRVLRSTIEVRNLGGSP